MTRRSRQQAGEPVTNHQTDEERAFSEGAGESGDMPDDEDEAALVVEWVDGKMVERYVRPARDKRS